MSMIYHSHDVMRRRLLEAAGIDYAFGALSSLSLDQVKASFACPEFHRMMDDKFVVGAYRYGLITEQTSNGKCYDHIASIRRRLDHYDKTGDLDVLPDIANLCKAEWIVPHHPNAHHGAEDDHGYYAPGRMS